MTFIRKFPGGFTLDRYIYPYSGVKIATFARTWRFGRYTQTFQLDREEQLKVFRL